MLDQGEFPTPRSLPFALPVLWNSRCSSSTLTPQAGARFGVLTSCDASWRLPLGKIACTNDRSSFLLAIERLT